MSLALFDLDDTLLAGDSDYLWGRFLVDHRLVDVEGYEAANHRFHQDYLQGRLDIGAYLRFQLGFLATQEPETLHRWHRRFMAEVVQPIIRPKGVQALRDHERAGDTVLIITATNRFVTGPIVKALGVQHLLATEPELVAGRYTGHHVGIPCFREGKVVRLEAWLKNNPHDLQEAWFYSDSRNDIPLLERVGRPVAVDPDPVLRAHAVEEGWRMMSFK
ncbi:MAG: HAD family hydrolase [Magnetococcales bacterium]|nr:HAD family hydrolase [Magnetococcales bacterium]